jgi:hypothetical protein
MARVSTRFSAPVKLHPLIFLYPDACNVYGIVKIHTRAEAHCGNTFETSISKFNLGNGSYIHTNDFNRIEASDDAIVHAGNIGGGPMGSVFRDLDIGGDVIIKLGDLENLQTKTTWTNGARDVVGQRTARQRHDRQEGR